MPDQNVTSNWSQGGTERPRWLFDDRPSWHIWGRRRAPSTTSPNLRQQLVYTWKNFTGTYSVLTNGTITLKLDGSGGNGNGGSGGNSGDEQTAQLADPIVTGATTAACVCDFIELLLFRAVEYQEYEQVMRDQVFRNPMGINVKYFATDIDGAVKFATLANKTLDVGFRVIQSSIGFEDLTPDMHISVDGSINAVVVTTEKLPQLSQPIDTGVTVGRWP